MKIEATNPLRQNQSAGRGPRRAAGGGFADTLAGLASPPRPSGSLTGAAPTGTLHAILALQGLEDPGERRRQAAARGLDLLDMLDDLRQYILSGAVPQETLARLSAVAGERRADIDDPALAAVLDEIDLRAQVELAKLGMLPEAASGD